MRNGMLSDYLSCNQQYFLLCTGEVRDLLSSSELKCPLTDYAIAQGAKKAGGFTGDDGYYWQRGIWWLRSLGSSQQNAIYIDAQGKIVGGGFRVGIGRPRYPSRYLG